MCSSRYQLLRPLAVLLTCLLCLSSPSRAGVYEVVDTLVDSGVAIEVSSFYSNNPGRGFIPLQFSITNHSSRDGVWRVECINDGYGLGGSGIATSAAYAVPAGESRTYELLAAVDNNRNLRLQVNGPGVFDSNSYLGLKNDQYYIGLSPEIQLKHETALVDWYQKNAFGTSRSYGGSTDLGTTLLDPRLLSTDWRAYIGFDAICYDAGDWLSLPAAVRSAILQWVATGGDLRLLASSDNALQLPASDTDGGYGLGRIFVFAEAQLPKTWPAKIQETYFAFSLNQNLWTMQGDKAQFTKARDQLDGDAARQPGPAVVVIIIFAIVAGPINLFYFCRGSKRPRLLVITPLLSLGAALLLVLLIIITDGIGGEGLTSRFTLLLPKEKTAVEYQRQVSRTGLLLGTSFDLSEPAWVSSPINLNTGEPSPDSLNIDGPHYSGWFASGRDQEMGQVAVLPSRSSVLLISQPGEPPRLRSEYPGLLTALYYVDAQGTYWKAPDDLLHGDEVDLVPAGENDYNTSWSQVASNHAASLQSSAAERVAARAGWFYAQAEDTVDPLATSVPHVRWKNAIHLISGPVQ